MEVRFDTREIDWLNDYAGNHGMSVEAVARMSVRWMSLVVGTPGAREAVLSCARAAGASPKWEPKPPIDGPAVTTADQPGAGQ